MLHRALWMVVAMAAVALTGTAARADFIIDTFTNPDPAISYSLAGPVGSTYAQTDGLPGGITRNLLVTQTQNDLGIAGSTRGVIGNTTLGGRYTLGTDPGTTAWTSLLYTYTSPQDLSAAGTALKFTFSSVDLSTPFSVRISDGTNTATQVGVVTTPSSLSLDLSGFGGSVNLTHIASIELILNKDVNSGASTTSADISLTDVRLTTPDGVPAPPAIVLLLAAAPILGAVRLVRRRAVA